MPERDIGSFLSLSLPLFIPFSFQRLLSLSPSDTCGRGTLFPSFSQPANMRQAGSRRPHPTSLSLSLSLSLSSLSYVTQLQFSLSLLLHLIHPPAPLPRARLIPRTGDEDCFFFFFFFLRYNGTGTGGRLGIGVPGTSGGSVSYWPPLG